MTVTPNPPPGSTGGAQRVDRRNLAIAAVGTLVVGILLIAGGVWEVIQRETGTSARATITTCETTDEGKYSQTFCTGSWEIGGSLLDGGHLGIGDVDGAGTGDIGKTIDITVHGDKAYARRLGLPLFIAGLGAVIAGGGVFFSAWFLRTRPAT